MKLRKTIAIPSQNGFDMIALHDILYVQLAENYSKLTLQNNQFTRVDKPLGWVLDQLNEAQGFFRIHQEYIVNLKFVEKYIRKNGGQLKMINGELLNMSKNQKEKCLNLLYGI